MEPLKGHVLNETRLSSRYINICLDILHRFLDILIVIEIHDIVTLYLLNKKASVSSDILVDHVTSSQNESGLSIYLMVHE